jgi:hypothetical protein
MGAYPKIGIVIGLDGLGKTPLLELMADLDDRVEVRQLVPDPTDKSLADPLVLGMQEVHLWEMSREDRIFLYDRFPWPDDWVYSSLNGHRNTWRGAPGSKHQILESRLLAHQVRFVYVEPPPWKEYVRKQIAEPDRLMTLDALREAYVKYRTFVDDYRRRKLPLRVEKARFFTKQDAIDILDWISPDRSEIVTGQLCPVCDALMYWSRGQSFCPECPAP